MSKIARIAEREKFLAVLNAGFQMRQSQINLLRQTGELESWVKTAAQMQPIDTPKPCDAKKPGLQRTEWNHGRNIIKAPGTRN